jgi:hypothetical protein
VSDAGCGSGMLRLRREHSAAFLKRNLNSLF